MCEKTYQDLCYNSCGKYKNCNCHKLHTCDICGGKIQPGKLIVVNGQFFACSEEHSQQLQNKLEQAFDWDNLAFFGGTA